MRWEAYPDGDGASVVGDVRVLRDVESVELGNRRDVVAYLPPSYAHGNRDLPVLYLHDGQNLFDERASYSGEWHVDESMEKLACEGVEAAVVGIANAGRARGDEYSPWPGPDHRGDAGAYLRFVADVVRPLVEDGLGLAPPRERTAVAGSSLGGLVSVWALFARPDVFGLCAALSPAFWFAGRRIFDFVTEASAPAARIYLDAGGREGHDERTRRAYLDGLHEMAGLLRRKGYGDESLRVVVDPDALHHESAWSARFPGAARFLLAR